MPFISGDPKTRRAGIKGGNTGTKHLETLSKTKLRKLSSKAGKISGERRREAKAAKIKAEQRKRAAKYEDKVMGTFLT